MRIAINHPNINSTETQDTVLVLPEELNTISDNSCQYINVADFMDFIPLEQRLQFLQTCLTKLRKNGAIYLTGVDLYAVSRSLISGSLPINKANGYLFNSRLSTSCCQKQIEELVALGIVIERAQINNLFYSIKGMRP